MDSSIKCRFCIHMNTDMKLQMARSLLRMIYGTCHCFVLQWLAYIFGEVTWNKRWDPFLPQEKCNRVLICGQGAHFNDHITWLVISKTSVYEIFYSHNKTKEYILYLLPHIWYIQQWKHQVWQICQIISYIYLHMNKSLYIHHRTAVRKLQYIPRILVTMTETSMNIYVTTPHVTINMHY